MDTSRGFAVKKKILLIFAKQPLAGMTKTRLSPPLTPQEAATLYGDMLRDVLETTANLPQIEQWLCYTPQPTAVDYFRTLAPALYLHPQRGLDLGERLANAFSEAFAAGADQVVVIGTDAPDLPASLIERAFTYLNETDCDLVFGPATDGGYYLLGMKTVWRELFAKIPWSTAQVLQVSLARATAAGLSTLLLPEWRDMDTIADLEFLTPEVTGAARHTLSRLRKFGFPA